MNTAHGPNKNKSGVLFSFIERTQGYSKYLRGSS